MTSKFASSLAALIGLCTMMHGVLAAAETNAGAASELQPFRIHVEDSVLADLQERLAKTRWPDQVPGSAWEYVVDVAYMEALIAYWRAGYDWRTLGYALNDSPAGLAAWIVDKFWAWSDHGGNLDNSFTKDELLTNIMLYWVTQTMPSATRIYFDSQHDLPRPPAMTPFPSSGKPAPMGFALFPKEINVPPRAWVERSYGAALIHWTEMPRGGHFAAMEQPKLLTEDIRAFFRKVHHP